MAVYAMRFEAATKASSTRLAISTAVIASYACGLMLAVYLSSAYHHPQPALLYLLPCVLVSSVVSASRRGLLAEFWHGEPLITADKAHQLPV